MSFVNAPKKIKLVTLPDQDRKSLSFEKALEVLAKLLMDAPLQELVQTLAEISCVFHEKSSEEAENYLRKRFCSEKTIEAICPKDDAETVNFLFRHNALYELDPIRWTGFKDFLS